MKNIVLSLVPDPVVHIDQVDFKNGVVCYSSITGVFVGYVTLETHRCCVIGTYNVLILSGATFKDLINKYPDLTFKQL